VAPPAEGADLHECTDTVDDWLAGWDERPSFHGAALAIIAAGSERIIGQVGLGDRGGGVVELIYGVAPDQRGRGHVSRATRVAARWLVEEGIADEVELRIDADAAASQHVARNAGFVQVGTVSQFVPGTGETFEDLRYVWQREHPTASR
jgi:RimJ/RimL family protein N-acetyltransferase